MRKLLFLTSAQRFADFALLLLRLFVGLFLIWGVWDNITERRAHAGIRGIPAQTRLPGAPRSWRPSRSTCSSPSAWAFMLGLFTRWAGIVCAIHFAIAIVMVDRLGGMRGIFPSGCLVVIGLYLATHGAGRFSVDAALRANELPRPTAACDSRS